MIHPLKCGYFTIHHRSLEFHIYKLDLIVSYYEDDMATKPQIQCKGVRFRLRSCLQPSHSTAIKCLYAPTTPPGTAYLLGGVRLVSQPDAPRFSRACVVGAAWRVVSGVRCRVPIIFIFVAAGFLFPCSPYGDPCFLCLPVYKETMFCVTEVRDLIVIISYLRFSSHLRPRRRRCPSSWFHRREFLPSFFWFLRWFPIRQNVLHSHPATVDNQ